MTCASRFLWACGLSLAAVIAFPPTFSQAAPANDAASNSGAAAAAEKPPVDLFDAMKSGDVEVKFIAKNSREATLLVKNKSDQPLTVKLPDAFAAVPILAQNAAGVGGAGGANNRTNRSTNNNNQNQGVGGGGLGGGVGGGVGGGGAFNVAPEKVAKIKLEIVCLEHGKKEPSVIVPYEIKPIESFTSDPKVQELCKLVGSGQIDQHAAQAAAWHLANHMTWEDLADKKIHHLLGGDEIYFSPSEIQSAMQITDRAMKAADARESNSTTTATSNATPDTTAASSGKN